MQLFNQVNSRKVYHEWNVLSGLFANQWFLVIWAAEVLGQVLIVEFGAGFFHTEGLKLEYWLLSIGLGILSIPVQIAIVTLARAVSPKASKPWLEDGKPLGRLSSKLIGGLASTGRFRRNHTRELADQEVWQH
jgi:hypothetical protein